MKNSKNLLLVTLFTLVTTLGFGQYNDTTLFNIHSGSGVTHSDTAIGYTKAVITLHERENKIMYFKVLLNGDDISNTIFNKFSPIENVDAITLNGPPVSDTIYLHNNDILKFNYVSGDGYIQINVKFFIENGGVPLSINDVVENKLELSLYPNPTTEYLNLDSDNNLYNSTYTVYSLNGQAIRQGTLGDNRLYIGDLPKGMYFIKLDVDGSDVVKEFEVR